MTKTGRFAALIGLVVSFLVLVTMPVQADTLLGTETETSAGVVFFFTMQTSNGTILFQFGSDGESAFNPLGLSNPTDYSDFAQFSTLAPHRCLSGCNNPFDNIFLIQVPGENEPSAEPVIAILFPGTVFSTPGVIRILDPTGHLSDLVTFTNTPGGGIMTFSSDPTVIPEPGTLALFGSGLLGLAGLVRRKLLPM